jgi:cation:H+ antiporter
MIVLYFVLVAIGLALLVKGSDVFVEASAGIAKNFKVPTFIIGLTVMAFGTSAPEAIIGVRAAIDGTVKLAMGNVIGSDIFNLISIIGIAAVINPMKIDFKKIARDYWVALSGPIVLLIMMLIFNDYIPRIGSSIFLVMFVAYVWVVIKNVRNRPADEIDEEVSEHIPRPLKKNILFAVIGLALIIAGGELTVHFAVNIAEALGMSARVVGLTIIAIGTSLPELTIVLMASKRGENELAVGNIIGSSIFNIMFVLGLAGVITPLPVYGGIMFDIGFLLIGSLIFLTFVLTGKKLGRIEGLIMTLMYTAYLVWAIWF